MIDTRQLQSTLETTKKIVEQEKKKNPPSEEEATKPSYFKPNLINYSFEGRNIGSSIGFALGVAYAFKVKSGFWKGWGYAILGGFILGGVGYGVGMAKKKKTD
tara:strand:- start:3806 stop:4114 length:309 start_codon:yes stop_codon:yes gene_type:complete